MKAIFKYEWLQLVRNRVQMLTILFFILTGLYSIYQGSRFLNTQVSTIHTIDTVSQSRFQKQVANFTADTSTAEGKSAYKTAHDPFMNAWYTKAMLWKTPSPLQGLTIGQSDTQPFYYGTWVYNDNIYTSKKIELRNPDKLLSGNFDLAYVFVYLLPLILIAFSYNILSSDREQLIESILKSQGVSTNNLLLSRFAFRLIIFSVLVCLLSVIGFIVNSISDIKSIAGWLLICHVYVIFWIGILYMIAALQKNSQVTSLLMVSSWLLFILFIPAAINSLSDPRKNDRLILSDEEREYSIHLWDLWQNNPKKLIDTFFSVVPELSNFKVSDSDKLKAVAYSYLDIVRLNDVGWKQDSMQMINQNKLASFNFFNPAFATQRALNELAETESYQFSEFRRQAADYHLVRTVHLAKLRLIEEPFTVDKMKSYPEFHKPVLAAGTSKALCSLWPLLPLMIMLFAAGTMLSSSGKRK